MQPIEFTNGPGSIGLLGIVAFVPILAFLVLLTVFAFLLIRNGQRRREWEHAERMRMIEMGLPILPRDAPWAKAAVCIAIGAVVPFSAFLFTNLAYQSKMDAASELWLAPSLVGGACVIGASILAGVLFHGVSKSSEPSDEERTAARLRGFDTKPAHDPDAVDVVGRRG